MSEIEYTPYDSAGNKYGKYVETWTGNTANQALPPKVRKARTIALLERVQRGEITPAKAFELLKEIV